MKTANGVILLPHRPFEAPDTTSSTHAPPLSADWSEDGSLFRTSPFLPTMSIFSFILLLVAMAVVVLVGIRIAMMSGRTTGSRAGTMIMRWRGQQTPLSPLAFGTGRRKRSEEESSDEEMGLDVVDEEKRMMAMTLDVPSRLGSERDARVWRL